MKRFARLLAHILLPKRDREFLLGDLEELHAERSRRQGRLAADWKYFRDVIASAFHRRVARGPAGPDTGPNRGGRRDTIFRLLHADLRTAVRSLRRHPGFTTAAVVTLALGMGSTAAVFGMVNQVLLRPLPGVAHTDGAAYLQLRIADRPQLTQGSGQGFAVPVPDFDQVRREATLVDAMALYGRTTVNAAVGDRRPVKVDANVVYGDFFDVLGVRPSAGRLLRAAATDARADPSRAVISERLRAALFGSSEDVVGRSLRLNGHEVTVIGVAGDGFSGPERGARVDVWLPYPARQWLSGITLERLRSRRSPWAAEVILQPRSGAGMEAVEAQIRTVLDRLAASDVESAEYLAAMRPVLLPGLHTPPSWRETTYTSLRLLGGIVALVLLIACANVANLLLVRDAGRRDRVATRRALGASTARVVREHLSESLLLAILAAALGMAVAALAALPFRGIALERMPAFEAFSVDWRVAGFGAALALLTTVLFGTIPALLSGRFDLGAALRASRGLERGRAGTLRWLMSTVQVAVSVALLVGGLLLARTIHNLYAVDTGLSVDDVVTLRLDVPPDAGDAERRSLYGELLSAVSGLPVVEATALDVYGPHGEHQVPGRVRLPGDPEDQALWASLFPVTPAWFGIFDMDVVEGRIPEETDWAAASPPRAVITRSLALRLFGRTDVAGRTLVTQVTPEERVISGVIEDIRMADELGQPTDAVFVPFPYVPIRSMTLVARTRRFDDGVARQIRDAVEGVLTGQPVPDPTPLSARVDEIHSERRIFARLLGLLAGLGVLLATVGLYAVVAFSVTARSREFGIRLALGAEGSRIMRIIFRYAASIIVAGTLAGLAGAYALSRVLRSRLFGVEPVDAMTYTAAALLFGVVAAVACWLPARAVTRLDPASTLRAE